MKNWMIILDSVLLTATGSSTPATAEEPNNTQQSQEAVSQNEAPSEPTHNATTTQQNANTILQSTPTQGVGLDDWCL